MWFFTENTPEDDIKNIENYEDFIIMIDYLWMNWWTWKEDVKYKEKETSLIFYGSSEIVSFSPVYNFKWKDYILYSDIFELFINKVSQSIIDGFKLLNYQPIVYNEDWLSVKNNNWWKESFTEDEIEGLLEWTVILPDIWSEWMVWREKNFNKILNKQKDIKKAKNTKDDDTWNIVNIKNTVKKNSNSWWSLSK